MRLYGNPTALYLIYGYILHLQQLHQLHQLRLSLLNFIGFVSFAISLCGFGFSCSYHSRSMERTRGGWLNRRSLPET